MAGDEPRVTAAFCDHLRADGWTVTTEVGFCDVFAERNGARLYAEAKGITAEPSLDADTLYGQLLRRMSVGEDPVARYVVVVPAEVAAAALRVPDRVRDLLRIEVFTVDARGAVTRVCGRSPAPTRSNLNQQQVSEAGEHYVLYRLYLLGLVGGQAPRGMPETDLLVMRPDGEHVATVQVKARSKSPRDGGWHMQAKHEYVVRPKLFYVFVGLETSPPVSYVIPSAVVAEVIARAHRTWLNAPGRGGRAHRDSSFRRLCPDYGLPVPGYPAGWAETYRERWDLLDAPGQVET